MNLSGKVLVVTGSDGALGSGRGGDLERATARGSRCCRMRREPAAERARGAAQYGGVDLTREDAARAAMQRIAKDAGRLDGLINIAGGFRFEKLARRHGGQPGTRCTSSI